MKEKLPQCEMKILTVKHVIFYNSHIPAEHLTSFYEFSTIKLEGVNKPSKKDGADFKDITLLIQIFDITV